MTRQANTPWHIQPVIVVSFFLATSLWFATNIIIKDLRALYTLPEGAASDLTSAVQFGFMAGTLLFAFLNVTDRLAPRVLFLVSTLIGALLNLLIIIWASSFIELLCLRFFTGVCLGGVYPAAVKTTATWFDRPTLGKAMSYTIGALALGTALPHLFNYYGTSLDVYQVVYTVSGLAVAGGILMYTLVPNGPYLKMGTPFDWQNIINIFKNSAYTKTVLAFVGHMWELFAFWQFIPLFVGTYLIHKNTTLSIPLLSYFIIALGFIGCIVGGYVTMKKDSRYVARYNILASGIFGLVSPLAMFLPLPLFIAFMLLWGFAVLGDSPQFSTLVSTSLEPKLIGTGITLMICIGYTISIFSIQLLEYLSVVISPRFIYLPLAIGPLLGYYALREE